MSMDTYLLEYAREDIAALAHLPKTYAPKVPLWAGQVETWPGPCSGAAAGPTCNGWAVAVAAYGTHGVRGTEAFAYLWRRFGPPWRGSDNHKELARYILHTSHPEIFLTLRLSASTIAYGVGYLVTQRLQEVWQPPRLDRNLDVCTAIHEALIECLRPVFIRDVAINILGTVSDSNLDDRETAAYSPYAGYGMPREALDSLVAQED